MSRGELAVFAFHPEVEALFRAAGWSPERRAEVAPWDAALRTRGFQLFPAAERVIESVGGLTVRGPARAETRWYPREIAFAPCARVEGEFDQFERWQQLVGQRLYPLADLTPRLCVMVAEDGSIFAGIKNLFYRYGATFEEAMELYFLGPRQPVRCAWCD
jgi:hypothetical protein